MAELGVKKADFLKVLDLVIPFECRIREAIVGLAGILILEDNQRLFIGDLRDQRISDAIHAYQQANSSDDEAIPVLSDLFGWLVKASAIDPAASSEERLEWIHNKLVDFGFVPPDARVEVSGSDILLLRILSDTSIDE